MLALSLSVAAWGQAQPPGPTGQAQPAGPVVLNVEPGDETRVIDFGDERGTRQVKFVFTPFRALTEEPTARIAEPRAQDGTGFEHAP